MARGMVWQIGECFDSCEIADVSCFTTLNGCKDFYEQEAAIAMCKAVNQDPNNSCSSCIETNDYCIFELFSKTCFMGAEYWGNPEMVATNIEQCTENGNTFIPFSKLLLQWQNSHATCYHKSDLRALPDTATYDPFSHKISIHKSELPHLSWPHNRKYLESI